MHAESRALSRSVTSLPCLDLSIDQLHHHLYSTQPISASSLSRTRACFPRPPFPTNCSIWYTALFCSISLHQRYRRQCPHGTAPTIKTRRFLGMHSRTCEKLIDTDDNLRRPGIHHFGEVSFCCLDGVAGSRPPVVLGNVTPQHRSKRPTIRDENNWEIRDKVGKYTNWNVINNVMDPSRGGIDALYNYVKKVLKHKTKSDLVIFYFCGDGFEDDTEYCW